MRQQFAKCVLKLFTNIIMMLKSSPITADVSVQWFCFYPVVCLPYRLSYLIIWRCLGSFNKDFDVCARSLCIWLYKALYLNSCMWTYYISTRCERNVEWNLFKSKIIQTICCVQNRYMFGLCRLNYNISYIFIKIFLYTGSQFTQSSM